MRRVQSRKCWALLLWYAWQAPACAADPTPLAPKPAWSVNIEPGRCTLSHPADVGEPSVFAIRSWAGEDSYQLVIETHALPFPPSKDVFQATIDFEPGHASIRQSARTYHLDDGNDILEMSGVGNDVLNFIAHSSGITIAKGKNDLGPISLPSTQNAITALQKCLHDQLIDWGADPAQFEPGGQPPVASKDRDDFIPNDTLLKLVFDGDYLDSVFKLGISSDGSISSCERIDNKSGENVEHVVCSAILSKKLFSSAKAPSGSTVNGIATFHVTLSKGSH